MIIPIDAHYRLAGDTHAWMIQKRKARRAGATWEPISWYPTLEEAVHGLAERLLRTAEAAIVAEALVEAKRITTRLSLALHPAVSQQQDG